MTGSPVIHDTFVLERTLKAPPERVFQGFSDPALKRRWFAEGEGGEAGSYDLDFRVGGSERSSLPMGPSTPFPGVPLENDGRIEDIVPGERIVSSATMSLGGRRISTALVTVELAPSGGGTRLTLTHQAVFYPGADGPEMRKGGWNALLDRFETALGA